MSEIVYLDKALCLSQTEINALNEGRIIVAVPRVSIQKGWSFLLYPYELNQGSLPLYQQYRSAVLSSTKTVPSEHPTQLVEIKSWARCEFCTTVFEADSLEVLSYSTVWTTQALHTALQQRQHIFLACLQVYQLSQPITVSANTVSVEKFGKFVGLPTLDISDQVVAPLPVTSFLPVLDETTFDKRKEQLQNNKPPLHFELEELQSEISSLINTNPAAQELDQEIRSLLGWPTHEVIKESNSNLDWIGTITETGNSSEGNLFEKLVRKSFVELGFTNTLNDPKASLDPEAVGGAGGIDIYCEAPFPLVGECKASKHESVPNSVSAQLIHLGNTHLGKLQFDQSVKVIFAAGKLTGPAQKAALANQINVMRPETLQRLVELKAKYPNSINLLELKPCLEKSPFGEESDAKINRYIDQIWQKLRMRSQIVQSVQFLTRPNRTQLEVVEICTCYNIKFVENNKADLDNETIHEMLIELSSPLMGYLGRIQGTSLQSDRFYFLRDLTIN